MEPLALNISTKILGDSHGLIEFRLKPKLINYYYVREHVRYPVEGKVNSQVAYILEDKVRWTLK
jgi:hypothetical protein